MLKEKLFDTSLYYSLPETVRSQSIHEDFTGLYIETGNTPLNQRINARHFIITSGEVIDEITGKRVQESFSYKTEFLAKESRAGESFWQNLVNGEIGNLVITISPSGGTSPYKDARVNVGYKKTEREIEFYGIPTELSPSVLLFLAKRISEFSNKKPLLDAPENLREIAIPIQVPYGENPWDFMEEVFPLDSPAWQDIKNSLPWEIKSQISKKASSITKEMAERISHAQNAYQFISIGAWGEEMMQQRGFRLLSKSCPGATNGELLNKAGGVTTEDVFGNVREVSWSYHTGNCAHCGAKNVEVGPCSICKACEKIL